MPLISAALHGVIDLTSTVAPDAWRRVLQILLDGLRADREHPTPLPHEPLGREQVHIAMDERHARESSG